MLFDGPPAALPTATLRPTASGPRHEVASLHVVHWITSALGWARPRAVPLVVAFIGMLAVLGATRYLLTFSPDVEAAASAPPALDSAPAISLAR